MHTSNAVLFVRPQFRATLKVWFKQDSNDANIVTISRSISCCSFNSPTCVPTETRHFRKRRRALVHVSAANLPRLDFDLQEAHRVPVRLFQHSQSKPRGNRHFGTYPRSK
ncbi:hypothetical protein M404DRAFT_304704 [Pisolithus tinctorius Marx 270]|uniref:Uncharacterized protein n=1 Tax=Pisolithus tinctorius Marx 270 TaxID=870435 RepID=A0A0C3PK57_PISTI|nr:hypothetical protein M404DRAFT_304704 [Pisolithus tinctorius Marx 270]